MEDEEGQLDTLEVLQDEDEDQHQGNDPNDECRPGAAEACAPLARIGLPSGLRVRR